MNKKKPDILLVSFDNFSNDVPIVIVGRKSETGTLDIVNAFQDEEALKIYKKLTVRKGDD